MAVTVGKFITVEFSAETNGLWRDMMSPVICVVSCGEYLWVALSTEVDAMGAVVATVL